MKSRSSKRAEFERLKKPLHVQTRSRAGIGPNKAAGSKGGIRRQGSKR